MAAAAPVTRPLDLRLPAGWHRSGPEHPGILVATGPAGRSGDAPRVGVTVAPWGGKADPDGYRALVRRALDLLPGARLLQATDTPTVGLALDTTLLVSHRAGGRPTTSLQRHLMTPEATSVEIVASCADRDWPDQEPMLTAIVRRVLWTGVPDDEDQHADGRMEPTNARTGVDG